MTVSFNRKKFLLPQALSLKSSLVFILFSMFFCFFPILVVIKTIQNRSEARSESADYQLEAIVQTGPRMRALPSQYLLQQLGISKDSKESIYSLDTDYLKDRLIVHPVISDAIVDIIPPDTLYIDYTVRNPKAILGNWENTAIDSEFTLFPLHPYYTPKDLPKIYISENSENLEIKWGKRYQTDEIRLSFEYINLWEEALHQRGVLIKQIDVSDVFNQQFGQREVILQLERVASGKFFFIRTHENSSELIENFLSYIFL